jgi:hypothetical protein
MSGDVRTGGVTLWNKGYFQSIEIFFIPVRIGDCQPPQDRLREIQWVDFFPDWEEGLRQLGKVLSFVSEQATSKSLSNTKWRVTQSLKAKEWSFFIKRRWGARIRQVG